MKINRMVFYLQLIEYTYGLAFVQSNKTRHKIMEKIKMKKKNKEKKNEEKKIYETIPMENHEWIMILAYYT